MGHYRPWRPRLNEDPMKVVEILNDTVDKIKQGKFRGFSKWTSGIPTPEVHAQRRMGRLRALNHGVEPRIGVSVNEARNHSRYINSMVKRIENLQSPSVRSKDFTNANMHPVLLRRPITKKKKQKVKAELIEQDRIRDLGYCVEAPEVVIRDGTPLCYTPKAQSKLMDGTHLCDRHHYDDSKLRKKYFSGADIDRAKKEYQELINNPQGLATLTTKPWTPPPPPLSTYDPAWRIDMRLPDLPCDLQATSNWHTLDDPLRPSSSRKPYYDVFEEREGIYDENFSPLPVPCHTPRLMLASTRAMKDSHTTPVRPGCSSSKHVHLADLKLRIADPVGEEMSNKFGKTFETLPSVPEAPLRWPHGHRTSEFPVTPETQSPVSPKPDSLGPESPISSRSASPSPISGTRPSTPVSTDFDNPDLKDGEIPLKYNPDDECSWKLAPCCSMHYSKSAFCCERPDLESLERCDPISFAKGTTTEQMLTLI